MAPHRYPTGVCIVRVERATSGLRFSVLTTPDASVDRAWSCTETARLVDAVHALEDFLIDFARRDFQSGGGRPTG